MDRRVRRAVRKPLIWLAWKVRGRRVGKRVICMHSVRDQWKFRKRMIWLAQRWSVKPLATLELTPVHIPAVALTFDDGSESWFDVVMPVLAELNMFATFFVNDQKLAERIEQSPERFRWEVGGHTRDHVDLGREVRPSVLEWQIEEKSVFAYPYGTPENVNPTVAEWIRHRYEIEDAFTCAPGWFPGTKFLQPRDSLDLSDPEWYWEARLGGAGDWFYRRVHKVWWE